MKVHELIEKLNNIEDKNAEVYVYTFADIGSGWSELTKDFEIIKADNGIYLTE
ncbi:hypothetical protein [Psychrobacillus phage Perkons]|nr:hypothetical protein [Psychrobacillus phage Perkons]